jgi:hypothetical protein
VLGYLVAAMGAVGVGGIGFCHGYGWVLGEFGKKIYIYSFFNNILIECSVK